MKDLMRPLPLAIQQSLHRSLSSTSQPVNLPQHPDNTVGIYCVPLQAKIPGSKLTTYFSRFYYFRCILRP